MIHSLLTTDNPINSTESIRQWIEQRNCEVQVDVKLIPFKEMTGWYVDEDGSLRHNSGRFFSFKVFMWKPTMELSIVGTNP